LSANVSSECAHFSARAPIDVCGRVFLQWLTGRSYGEAQRVCRESGMKVGLIADLAIGMDGGSHGWSRQHEVLGGLSIGAPPDYYSAEGQSWGLTTLSMASALHRTPCLSSMPQYASSPRRHALSNCYPSRMRWASRPNRTFLAPRLKSQTGATVLTATLELCWTTRRFAIGLVTLRPREDLKNES
jgi:hypothetical protein